MCCIARRTRVVDLLAILKGVMGRLKNTRLLCGIRCRKGNVKRLLEVVTHPRRVLVARVQDNVLRGNFLS